MAGTPNFTNAPIAPVAVVSAANTAFDGTGTLVTLLTPPSTSVYVPLPTESGGTYVAANSVNQPSNGVRVDRVVATARGTTVAGRLLIWLSDGTNAVILGTAEITAITPSTTVAPWSATINLGGISVPVGSTLRASITTANVIGCATFGEVL